MLSSLFRGHEAQRAAVATPGPPNREKYRVSPQSRACAAYNLAGNQMDAKSQGLKISIQQGMQSTSSLNRLPGCPGCQLRCSKNHLPSLTLVLRHARMKTSQRG